MKRFFQDDDHAMLTRLFFKLLPVQVALVAMGSVNSIVDGAVAGRFIDAKTVGVIGLYYTMVRILEAVGAVLLGGVSVLSGRYLGSGRIDRTRGVFSLGLALAFAFGAVITAASLLAPDGIAKVLGADRELAGPLATYIRGYAFGVIPLLVGQQLAAGLQLERKEKLGHAGVLTMITVNVALDIYLVAVRKMGIWGLALSTSLANWAYFLVLSQHYFRKDAQLVPSLKLVDWKEAGSLLGIGFPNALLVGCLAARSLAINRILLVYGGTDSLSAMSAFNMVSGLILSIPLGTGALVRMLSSVFIGEENREGLTSLIRITLTRVMAMIIGVTALVFLLSPVIAGIFFPDRTSDVYRMTRQLLVIFAFGIPVSLLCLVCSNYCQAAGHSLYVNIASLIDGFIGVVLPALVLAPVLGPTGIWLAFPIGLVMTFAAFVIHCVIRERKLPRTLDEWMMLDDDFGSGDRLVLNLSSMEDVVRTSVAVQDFCQSHGIDAKSSAYAGLCLEEIAGNIVSHGFGKDRKKHDIEVRVVLKKEGVALRIKDDCIPFNPKEMYEMAVSTEDPLANVGIRLVYGVADEVEYQNLLGLNVLTVRLTDPSYAHHGSAPQPDAV